MTNSESASEPDLELSEDSFGLDPNYTPEEIQRVENEARQADGDTQVPQTQVPQTQIPQTEGPQPDPESNKKRKKRERMTSKYWQYFIRGEPKEDDFYEAKCKFCGHIYDMGNGRGTGSLMHHFKKSCQKVPKAMRHKPNALQKMLQAGTTTAPALDVWEFNQMKCRKGLARMVVAHDYPFNCVNHYFLKEFLRELQPLFKVPSRNTLRADCLNIYAEEKDMLYDLFSKLDCKFSFTGDLWSNKGRDRGFMALTCHYIDESWKLHKRVIAFCPLPSPHTGKNIADAIYERLVLWNLDKKALCLVLDSSSANDACVKELLSGPILDTLPADGQLFHQRCGCHILNLIVQDGLDVLDGEIKTIRETMKYIRHSQSRMEKFKRAVAQVKGPDKKPAWDVQTRWNSTYLMLQLAFELREAIERFAVLDKNSELVAGLDWNKLKVLLDCLKVFYDATLTLSGTKYPTLNLFFPEFCEVCSNIKKMRNSNYPFIVEMSLKMYAKWDKYWTGGNMLLAIACVFDPRSKFGVVEYYIKEMYPHDYDTFMANLNNCINALFKDYENAYNRQSQEQIGSSSQQVSALARQTESVSRAGLKDYMKNKKRADPKKSELEEYLADGLDENSLDVAFDILSWWKLKAAKYPILSRLARDILAVPISTVASESTFSNSGRTLSPIRSSLNDESIEALICAQDWLRASVTENGGDFGEILWSSDETTSDADGIAHC
ncbi:hypothetical protein LUZ63_010248 [Rhynchospora breviuscula]|uniref:BED-type domain-containing protein n=1 Tax=Rhynchospora breviuscula TaxID=2022672 RepID=A0A9Q0CGQ7_9POAL|nr:hypothetical protein LUZ63_010248 [Rhynchospora breviuscula]